MEDAFVLERVTRYDIKGRKYIDSPFKYYFEDLGLRNAQLGFRQVEPTHMMENMLYNELRAIGMKVDVGPVFTEVKIEDGSRQRKTLEIDFVCNRGYERVYIQSAYAMETEEKRDQELTSRSNGWGYAKRKQKLKEYIKGWVGYYHLANMKRLLLDTDEWLRRLIRMCIWKVWKKVKTKVANLIRCGINKYKAYEWGNTRKGYWHIANSPILATAISNNNLRAAGYATLMGTYLEWHLK